MGINIVASAGTGKTYTLTQEIIRLVLSGVKAGRIFATTFTEKAASEIQTRIREELRRTIADNRNDHAMVSLCLDALEELPRAPIGTMHSLFLAIVRAHPAVTGVDSDTEILLGPALNSWFDHSFRDYYRESSRLEPEAWNLALELLGSADSIKAVFRSIYDKRGQLSVVRLEPFNPSAEKNNLKELAETAVKCARKLLNQTSLSRCLYELKKRDRLDLQKIDVQEYLNRILDGETLLPEVEIKENRNGPAVYIVKTRVMSGDPADIDDLKNILKETRDDPDYNTLSLAFALSVNKLRNASLEANARLILDRSEGFLSFLSNIKKRDRVIDTDDILILARALLRDHGPALEYYTRRYEYLFIDEFQDTDSVQTDIIRLLAQGRPDRLFLFGDPKQCIYEWRSASVDNYLEFISSSGLENREISVSYRSDPEILGYVNGIFSNPDKPYLQFSTPDARVFMKPLQARPAAAYRKGTGRVDHFHVPPDQDLDSQEILAWQADAAARVIRELHSRRDETGLTLYPYREIAILFRTKARTGAYIEALRRAGIPYVFYNSRDFFRREEIRAMLNLLAAIDSPASGWALAGALRGLIFSHTDSEILALSRIMNRLDYRLLDNIKDNGVEIIQSVRMIAGFNDIKDQLAPGELLNRVISGFHIREKLSFYPDGVEKLANIDKLTDMAASGDYASLHEFVKRCLADIDTDEPEPAAGESSDAVRIMTMHQSKGLTFNAVLLPGLSDRLRIDASGIHVRNGRIGICIRNGFSVIAENAQFREWKDSIETAIRQENRRLVYVAMTRARHYIALFSEVHTPTKDGWKGQPSLMKDLMDHTAALPDKIILTVSDGTELETSCRAHLANLPQVLPGSAARNMVLDSSELHNLAARENSWDKQRTESILPPKDGRFTTVSRLVKEADPDYKYGLDSTDAQTEDTSIFFQAGEAASAGSLVHETLENLPDILAGMSIENAVNRVYRRSGGSYTPPTLNDALDILRGFKEGPIFKVLAASRILAREWPFTLYDPEAGRFIDGRMDLVMEYKGQTWAVDYKTDRPGKMDQESFVRQRVRHYSTQSRIYLDALEKNLGFRPRFAFAFLTFGYWADENGSFPDGFKLS